MKVRGLCPVSSTKASEGFFLLFCYVFFFFVCSFYILCNKIRKQTLVQTSQNTPKPELQERGDFMPVTVEHFSLQADANELRCFCYFTLLAMRKGGNLWFSGSRRQERMHCKKPRMHSRNFLYQTVVQFCSLLLENYWALFVLRTKIPNIAFLPD